MGKLRTCFEAFGWHDFNCATLAGVSEGQLKEMLRSVVCRCAEKDWALDLDSKPAIPAIYITGVGTVGLGGLNQSKLYMFLYSP